MIEFNRGSERTYQYAKCSLAWDCDKREWIATENNSGIVIASAQSLPKIQDKLRNLRLELERRLR